MPRLASVTLLLVSLLASAAAATVPTPSTEGPVTGGLGKPSIVATFFDLSTVGYQTAEFFVSGTATAYTSATPLASDGKWSVTPGTTADYKTRVVVFRPTDPKKFKGTVVVEWLNVSFSADTAADWISAHTEMIREGMAWVGVSAQQLGVQGGTSIIGQAAGGVKAADPVRYASLFHPGDSFSYDIFSQVGQAIRHPGATSILGDLEPKKVIAVGDSQSAFRLTTYVNAIHPLAGVYDGFLIHSRGSGGMLGGALSEAPQPAIPAPAPTLIRTDLHVPVLVFETETDLTELQYFLARQPDTSRIRLWEVAGAAHADSYTLGAGLTDNGTSSATAAIVFDNHGLGCTEPVNSGPQHWVLDAAFAALNRWVRHGRPPAKAPRLHVSAGPPITIARDEHGNALGGIRTPWVDAPVASLSGEGNSGPSFCFIFGTTTAFDAATLTSLYPTHKAFVAAYKRSLRRDARGRYIVPADAALIKAWAAGSDVGG